MWHLRGIFVVSTYMVIAWQIKWQFAVVFNLCIVMWGLYVDYIISALGHKSVMWQTYLFRGICQYCEMYACQCCWLHYWLLWVHMMPTYWHCCLKSAQWNTMWMVLRSPWVELFWVSRVISGRLTWKDHSSAMLEMPLHIHCWGLLKDRALNQYDSFTQKIVLKGLFRRQY